MNIFHTPALCQAVLGTRDKLTIKTDKVLLHIEITPYVSERQIGVSITDHTIKYLYRQDPGTFPFSNFLIFQFSIAGIIHKKKGGKTVDKNNLARRLLM